MQLRSMAVLFSTSICLGLSAAAFWYQDWRYSLPTQRPIDLDQPIIGQTLVIPTISALKKGPVLLHFFNPDCPCSRFNVDHLRDLRRSYGQTIQFVAVLQGEIGREQLLRAFARLNLDMDAIVDESGAIGKATGVYATPQAVLLDGAGRLLFRGNYNRSRYCTEPDTAYAQIAIEEFLAGKPPHTPPPGADKAYGCPLPKRKQGVPAIV